MTTPAKIETPTPRTDAHRQPFIDRPSFELDDVLEAYELAEQLERELTQWREVAERLAQAVFHAMPNWPAEYSKGDGHVCAEITIGDHKAMAKALAAYDALAKLSDGGKG